MKLERRKFKYQGYYNSTQGYPVPCECVLEYIEPIEAETLETCIAELENENKTLLQLNAQLAGEAQRLRENNIVFLDAVIQGKCPQCGFGKWGGK